MTRFAPNGYQDYVGTRRTLVDVIGAAAAEQLDNIASFGGTGPGTSPAAPGIAVRQPARPAVGLQQPGERGERIRGLAEPASRRRRCALRRWLGPLHQEQRSMPYTWVVSSGRSTAARSSAPINIDRSSSDSRIVRERAHGGRRNGCPRPSSLLQPSPSDALSATSPGPRSQPRPEVSRRSSRAV